MKADFRLASNKDMEVLLIALDALPLDGSHIVKITDKEKRSAQQLSMLWKMFRLVAASGYGSADTADAVEVEAKWRWLRPMLCSIDTMYAEVMQSVERDYSGDPKMMKFVTAKLFHFSDLNVEEMAEVLQQIIDYYGSHGVHLPVED